jgi:hypothetical protein
MYETQQTDTPLNYWKHLTVALAAAMIITATLLYFSPGEILGMGITIVLVLVSTALFFLPAAIAIHRKHHQLAPILLINLFCGLSVIGWIVALVWSVADTKPSEPKRSVE